MVGVMPNRPGKGQLSIYIDESILEALRLLKQSKALPDEKFTITRWIEETLSHRLIKLGFLDRIPPRVEKRGGSRKRKQSPKLTTQEAVVKHDATELNPQITLDFARSLVTGRDLDPMALAQLAKELDVSVDRLNKIIRSASEIKNGNPH